MTSTTENLTPEPSYFFGLNARSKKTPRILLGIVVGLWLLGLLLLLIPKDYRGIFGDMFGAVNTLFSGLAFAGIVYSILIQNEELKAQGVALQKQSEALDITRKELEITREEYKLTRKEHRLTREEHKLARKEFATQTTNAKRQRFEGMFFNMLSLHFKIAEDVNPLGLFGRVLTDFKSSLHAHIHYADGNHDYYAHMWKDVIDKNKPVKIFQYLQSLLSMQQIISSEPLNGKAKARYYFIINSYLSDTEKRFMFYFITVGYKVKDIYASLLLFETEFKIVDQFAAPKLLDETHEGLKNYVNWNIIVD
jgi:hypothetical protein